MKDQSWFKPGVQLVGIGRVQAVQNRAIVVASLGDLAKDLSWLDEDEDRTKDLGYEYTSASSIETFEDCPRKWGFSKIDHLPRKEKPSTKIGKRVHKQLERHLRGGQMDPTHESGRIAIVSIGDLPDPKDVLPEEVEAFFKLDLSLPGDPVIPIIGFKDLVGPGKVWDHKSTSDFKWSKRAEDLATDTQPVIYAASEMQIQETDTIELQWNYMRSKPPYMCQPIRNTVTAQQIMVPLTRVRESAKRIGEVLRSGIRSANDLPANPETCPKYGGCDFKEHCSAANGPEWFSAAMKWAQFKDRIKKGETMSQALLNQFQAAGINPPGMPAPNLPGAPPAPALPPPVPMNGPPVPTDHLPPMPVPQGFPQAHTLNTPAGPVTVAPDPSSAHAPAPNPWPTPVPNMLPPSFPQPAPMPAPPPQAPQAFTPPQAPAAPQPVAFGVVQQHPQAPPGYGANSAGQLAPVGSPFDVTAPAPPPQAAQAPEAPKTPGKRGRKSNAEKAAEAAAQAQAGVQVPAPVVNQNIHVTTPAAMVAAGGLPAETDLEAPIRPTLFLDCAPVPESGSVTPVPGWAIIQQALGKIQENQKVHHYNQIQYEGRAHFQYWVQQILQGYTDADITLDTSTPEAKDALQVFMSSGRYVVRSTR